jgi:hypothetical protein
MLHSSGHITEEMKGDINAMIRSLVSTVSPTFYLSSLPFHSHALSQAIASYCVVSLVNSPLMLQTLSVCDALCDDFDITLESDSVKNIIIRSTQVQIFWSINSTPLHYHTTIKRTLVSQKKCLKSLRR